ncbi:MAG: CocE/NonD family hydrolase [Acidobacteria bacterium]|nr:CocE/NonD family hydrolase [Acidobacteriota bacterium]
MASHGYVVILQDTRGRFDSEGEFYPFRHKTEDGYDTVEWASALEVANGKVGMFGGSYVGATQMLAAISKPPHLTAIFPYVTASGYYDGWTYQSGVLMQWFASSWTSGLTIDTLRRKANLRLRPKEWVESFPVENYHLLDLPTASELAPYLRDWVAHETEDEYWKRWKISDHYPEMTVKGLHAGGMTSSSRAPSRTSPGCEDRRGRRKCAMASDCWLAPGPMSQPRLKGKWATWCLAKRPC